MNVPNRIWIEVDDLLRYFEGSLTPTGIGRVQLEILPCLARHFPDRVSFVRLGSSARSVQVLSFEDIARLTDTESLLKRHGAKSRLLPLLKFHRYMSQRGAASLRVMKRRKLQHEFAAMVRPGDVLLNIGSSWDHPHFGAIVQALKHEFGLRFALLIHDILPASHPAYCSPSHVPTFNAWLESMSNVWDMVLTPSKSSARMLFDHLKAQGRTPPPMATVPFGAGFRAPATPPAVLPLSARQHVLYVSTIEVRKNHALLFEVWRRLIERHGADKVPELIFAGKYGWEISDLRHKLKASRFLQGKIRIVENLSDDELSRLYQRSFFTVFPSFCEGWGLPVGESLAEGRYCVASNATSIPEVGGDFADYHDPADVEGAYRLIEAALFTSGVLEEKERRIRQNYTRPDWEQTAEALVRVIDAHLGA